MSDRGIYGSIIGAEDGNQPTCLIIGKCVPRMHHSDGVPVYLVIEHPEGIPVVLNDDGRTSLEIKTLLAYPSHWAAPGCKSERFIYAYREPMPWQALIPIFDVSLPRGVFPDPEPETITEACHRLRMPLPSKL